MTTLPLITVLERPRLAWRLFARWVAERMPKGLFARSLLIVIVPIVGLPLMYGFAVSGTERSSSAAAWSSSTFIACICSAGVSRANAVPRASTPRHR